MDPLFCKMVATDEMHPTIPNLRRYRCARSDCRRPFWSYTGNMNLPCRHTRGFVRRQLIRLRSLFQRRTKPAATTKSTPTGPKKPTLGTMLWDLGKSVRDYYHDPRHVSADAYEKRLAACQGCTFRTDTSCGLCGCNIATKALAAVWHCPAFKWEGDISPDHAACVLMLTDESQKQGLIELLQAAGNAKHLTVLDCLGNYVPFADEEVITALDWRTGMTMLPKRYAYVFMRPTTRGANLVGGMLWTQQISDAGVVMPTYAAVKQRMANDKQAPQYFRPIPNVSGDAFLITDATVQQLGWPTASPDLDWAMQVYSLEARMAGIAVLEAWSCSQQQDPPRLRPLPLELRGRLTQRFGPYWDMLISDSRVRNPLAGTPKP